MGPVGLRCVLLNGFSLGHRISLLSGISLAACGSSSLPLDGSMSLVQVYGRSSLPSDVSISLVQVGSGLFLPSGDSISLGCPQILLAFPPPDLSSESLFFSTVLFRSVSSFSHQVVDLLLRLLLFCLRYHRYLFVSVTGYGGNPRYSRYRVQILRYWVQTTVAGAKILGAKTASTTIKDGATSLNLVNNRRT
jgi:hypothetical protein